MRLIRTYLNKVALACVALLLAPAALGQSRNCLRVMPIQELTRNATFIGRVRVVRADKVRFEGVFGQIATLEPLDVIEGDFTLKEIKVLAKTNARCADDNYVAGQEMLVFLVPERGLYHTLNFQYGQFQVVGDVVKGWRDKSNKIVDAPYAKVRLEIEAYVNGLLKKEGEPPAPESTTPSPPGQAAQPKPPPPPPPKPQP